MLLWLRLQSENAGDTPKDHRLGFTAPSKSVYWPLSNHKNYCSWAKFQIILRVIFEICHNFSIHSAFDRNDIWRKKTRNYLFTSGNKFQDSNCTWPSDSMNNEYALVTSPKLHLVHRKRMGMNGWPIHQNANKRTLITRCRMPLKCKVWPPSLHNPAVEDAQCLGPLGAPPTPHSTFNYTPITIG